MNFQAKKGSFNLFIKQSDQQSNNSHSYQGLLKQANILSDNSHHPEQHYASLNNFMNENPQKTQKDESQEYLCITCNRMYDGIIRCRHAQVKVQQNEQLYSDNSGPNKNSYSKIYQCPYEKCDKTFNLESGLIRHRIVHTGEKPYSCDYQNCSQSFNQKSNLNRHKKIHKNQKPFICDKCCKSFTTTTNLKQHSQTHISKKQERKHYICEMKGCNKRYLYRCNLKKHKQEHEDPVGSVIVENENQRNVKSAKFEIGLGQCNISLQIRESSTQDHSEMKIVYDQSMFANAEIYNPSFILPNFQKEEKENAIYDQIKLEEIGMQDNLIRNLEEFFVTKGCEISTSFYIHPQLMEYSQVIIGQVITLLQEKGTKDIRFFVESKENFSRCAQNLMEIFFVRSPIEQTFMPH